MNAEAALISMRPQGALAKIEPSQPLLQHNAAYIIQQHTVLANHIHANHIPGRLFCNSNGVLLLFTVESLSGNIKWLLPVVKSWLLKMDFLDRISSSHWTCSNMPTPMQTLVPLSIKLLSYSSIKSSLLICSFSCSFSGVCVPYWTCSPRFNPWTIFIFYIHQ